MSKITLVNMPFASVFRSPIGLAQIKSRVQERFGDRVRIEIVYLNIDFSHYMGLPIYNAIAEAPIHHSSGLGDWLFRQTAFPELPDNSREYFGSFYQYSLPDSAKLVATLEARRLGLKDFLQELIAKYRICESDIVGFSSTFAQNVASIAGSRLLKEHRRDLITVMGGPNCESTMGRAIICNVPAIDFVFSGPSLVSFPEFVGYHLDGLPDKMHAIPGVLSRRNQQASIFPVIGEKPLASMGAELDINENIDLDYTDYLAKFASAFPGGRVRPTLTFETSRGCWWGDKAHCTFCGLNGETMSYRSMQAERAVGLLKSLFRHADVCTYFESVDNIMPRHYVTEVFARVAAPRGATIFYEVKADLSYSELAVLSAAGVKSIQPGIESLATSTLRLMKKGTTATQNVGFLRNCLMNGIKPTWNMLVGFPGEREDVYQKYCADVSLLSHLCPPNGVFPVRFDRFSPYFTRRSEYKLDLKPAIYYSLIYPFDARTLFDLAYYFDDANTQADYFVVMAKWLGRMRQKTDQWRKLWSGNHQAGAIPRLHFASENGGEVIDSRSGTVQRYDIGDGGRHVIESLSKPKTLKVLAQEFPDVDLDRELQAFKRHGLVFQEEDRLVSLVCPREPPE